MTDWDRIVADHGPTILRFACRILGRGPDAEDAVQEAFLQVYQIGQRETVTSWGGLLRRTVMHRALDRLRRRRMRMAEPYNEHAAGREDDPPSVAVARELAERLRDAIAQLPEQQAAVFSLRYFDAMSYEEIAASLELELAAVGPALHKARSKLRSMLTVSVQED